VIPPDPIYFSRVESTNQATFLAAPPLNDGANLVVAVPNLNWAGLVSEMDASYVNCYVRRSCKKLWVQLAGWLQSDAPEAGICWVTGPPGVGKSTEVLAFMMHEVRGDFVWVHESTKTSFTIFRRIAGVCSQANLGGETAEVIKVLNPQVCGAQVVVLDGVKSSLTGLAMMAFNRAAKTIICTSYGAEHMSDEQFAYLKNPTKFNMYSWTQDDLQAAWDLGVFGSVEGVSFDDVYFYAGGSARNMMLRNPSLVDKMDNRVSRTEDPEKYLNAFLGPRSPRAVDSLLAVFGPQDIRPISEYVSRRLSEKVGFGFILFAYITCQYSAPMLGWTFELEFLKRARDALDAKTPPFALKGTRANVIIGKGSSASYDAETGNEDFTFENVVAGKNVVGIFPKRYNNACFDFALITRDDAHRRYNVQLFQATIAEKHDFKYQHAAVMLQRLFPLQGGYNLCRGRGQAPGARDGDALDVAVGQTVDVSVGGANDISVHVTMAIVLPSFRVDRFQFDRSSTEGEADVQNFDPHFVHRDALTIFGLQLFQTGRAQKVHFMPCRDF
jgi:hypothetical protein